mgnify:CR=1 FL=1
MKVKLQEVLEALDGVGMDMEYYYDTKNEEILMIFDGMVNGETDPDLIEDIEEGFIEDYIPLPRQYDMNEYRMMEEFIYDLPAGRAQLEARVHSVDLRIGCTILTFRRNGISTGMIAMSK